MAENAAAKTSEKKEKTPAKPEINPESFHLTKLYRFRDLDTVIRAAHILQNSYQAATRSIRIRKAVNIC